MIAAQVKNWQELKAAKTLMLRRWIVEFVKNNNTTTILPRFVCDVMTASETIWQWRFLLPALTLAIRWSATASTTPWMMALILIPKVLVATLRAFFDVPHKIFVAVFPQLATAYRLLQMIYGCYQVYRFWRTCWHAARNMQRLRSSIRTTMAEAIRTLANWVMRRLAAMLWSVVREVFLWMVAFDWILPLVPSVMIDDFVLCVDGCTSCLLISFVYCLS
jgi:hypothetical protein